MEFRRKWPALGTAAVASAAVLAVSVTAGGAQAAQEQGGQYQGKLSGQVADSKPGRVKEDQKVTLITGDKVVLVGGDQARVRIERAEGREGVVFRTQRIDGRLLVIPMDVSSAVAAGKLDRRLFDVTGLIADGYDDAHSKVIPLIVSYRGRSAAKTVPGATVSRALPVLNGTAVKVAKNSTAGFVSQLTGKDRSAAGLDRVWLDGKRHTTLDQSVAQIGTPAAWKAGYTGKGVTVAVLDTGIDSSHADLKTRVGAAKNFTPDPAGDQFGHGTHVASTIAGTAAASGGKYKGVAPDAKLLDGKVCDGQGSCDESWILAGMEWAAVQQKAKVINLSLGGYDTPEVDPLEAAVNRLTARTGALFVIAAGNDGEAESVNSPGSADAALTVGAVDKQDQLASFSSRGPRVGDGALKPDVTAPGVDIVAAKAKGSVIGDPVGAQYLMLSGTSMATPHVAGAAALLAQQHPGWKAGELKGTLMGTSKPLPKLTPFEQGAGRIDVAKAITGSVISEPGGLSFGTALWPHHDDRPVVKQLTYRNLGKAAVKLTLQASATVGDKPAPAGAIKLSATSLTVPAGGTASVSVTSDTRHSGPDGLYSGRVVATAGANSVTTPLAVEKEIESYDLVIKHVRPDGQGSDLNLTSLVGIDNDLGLSVETDAEGTANLRLPKGKYFLDGALVDQHNRLYQLVWPQLVLDRATTAIVDARKAKPVKITLPKKDARLFQTEFGYERKLRDFTLANSVFAVDLGKVFLGTMGQPVPAADMLAFTYSRWGVPGKDGKFRNSPYSYDLLQGKRGSYHDGYSRVVRDSELAKVVTQYNADHPGDLADVAQFGVVGGMGASTSGQPFRYDLPARAVQYLETKGTRWAGNFEALRIKGEDTQYPLGLTSEDRTYQAGKTYRDRWAAAVATSSLADGDGSFRTGNELQIFMFPASDQDGHLGFSIEFESATTQLFRNGKLIASEDWPAQLQVSELPAEKGSFRLVSSQYRPLLQLATRTSNEWTFSSQDTGDKKEVLPLRSVQFLPPVDANNAVRRAPVSVLPLKVQHQPGAKVPAIAKVEVQVSGDGGKTWRKATVVPTGNDTYRAIFATPQKASLITLRSHVIDKSGNTATQSVTNAYRLR